MINNRQAGRRRGRGGQRTPNNPGRPEQGNRIDSRARGNAAQLLEKYKMLARDAQMQGDRVNTEYYHQFADHYFRVLSESRARFEEQNQQRRSRDDADLGEDDGDERETDRIAQEPRRQPAEERAPRDERRVDAAEERDEPHAREEPRAREARREKDREAPAQALNGHQAEEEAAAPRRGRPRRARTAEPEPVEAFDATILPPSVLKAAEPVEAAADAEAEAEVALPPRRRGRPRKVETDAASA
ncbi:DUF4167 domain-containing protein [Sphingomonas flavalba]|uniref:DUF4167 domain-containing protein n=1 Tax=Sphingomonas flavalba TaxID=2559804 RepID=UPI00109DA6AB|nr:DUF4167 domain-containing protein [Sphingomonas flavalba]